MSKTMLRGLVILMSLVLTACAGSSIPDDPSSEPLTFQLTADADSAIDPTGVEGEQVPVPDALATVGGKLPAGFTGVKGLNFHPALPPAAGFTGTLGVRLSQNTASATDSGYEGALLYLYYMNPETGETNFVDSSRASGEWVAFQVNMLGCFVIAGNDSIPATTDTFAAYAFADQENVIPGTAINFWAVAINGSAPYTFDWQMGDGSELGGDQISHSYSATGNFNVLVTITDATGATTTAYSTPIAVNADGAPVLSPITVTQDPALFNRFTYDCTVSGGAAPYTYEWDLDGNLISDSTDAPPVEYTHVLDYLMNAFGVFEGTLAVTDAIGQTVYGNFVTDARILGLTASGLTGPTPHIVEVQVSAGGSRLGDTVTVDFGDGQTVDTVLGPRDFSIAHTYETPGTYTLSASSTVTFGVEDYTATSDEFTIEITEPPTEPYIQLTQPIVPFFQQDLALHGYNFGETQGSSEVMLDDHSLTVTDWSDTLIRVEFPAAAPPGRGDLAITDGAAPLSNAVRLTLDSKSHPTAVQNVIPLNVEDNRQLLIVGHGFGTTPMDIDIDGTPLSVDAWDNFAIAARLLNPVPAGAQTLHMAFPLHAIDISVDIAGPPTCASPSLLSASPQPFTADGGSPLTLAGGGFGPAAGGLVFSAGFVLPVDNWTDTSIELAGLLPSVDSFAVVLNRQCCSNPLDLVIYGAPFIEMINPEFGAAGSIVEIFGHSFDEQDKDDRVTLGEVELIINNWTPNVITVELPTGIADGDIVVEKAVPSNAVAFDVVPPAPEPPNGEQL